MRIPSISIAKKQPILFAVIVFFAPVATLALYVHLPLLQQEVMGSDIDHGLLDRLDNFNKGQYFFNQDFNSEPPYNVKKARKYYTQAILDDPQVNPLAWHQLGRIDFLEGKFENAIYKFDKQIEYFGNTVPNVYYMLGLTYGYKARQTGVAADWGEAAKGFQTYLEHDPESPWARTDLAWVYFAQGKYEEMVPVLEEGLEHNPDHPWLLNMYGLALLNTQQTERALQNFLRAKEQAEKLTSADWGAAYPGNNPNEWAQGLKEFRAAIANNVTLAESQGE